MVYALLAVLGGFALMIWSADRFVDGASATARHAQIPSLIIGMVIVGFGTSAPEMLVSAIAAFDNKPDLALGNAIGSNIVNTGLILGVTALMYPLRVHSKIIRKELPLLILIGLLLGGILWDGELSRNESLVLLLGFFVLIGWTVFSAFKSRSDSLEIDDEEVFSGPLMSKNLAIFWLLAGFAFLLLSSRILVWGAVSISQQLGVSDLIVGLTVVALGTSLPELAASLVAARKGEHDIAIGNVIGSNMFNILAVVGVAGVISPIPKLIPEVLSRDWPVMMVMTFGLFVIVFGFRGEGHINRFEGILLLSSYIFYNAYLISEVVMI